MRHARVLVALFVLVVVANSEGCQFFPHWMQPSQLWKLNRQPAYDESSFSVPDPVPPPVSANAARGDVATTDSF